LSGIGRPLGTTAMERYRYITYSVMERYLSITLSERAP
jgi:hypothetical protein